MSRTFKTSNQGVKVKALQNMLDGNASSHAIKHFTREMNTLFGASAHEIPKQFIEESLRAGHYVVLFNTRNWIITSGGPYDVDFLVLRYQDGQVNYFGVRENDTDYNHEDYVHVDSLETVDILEAIVNDYGRYSSTGSLSRDYKVLALSNEAIYTPDWAIEALPEGWEIVKQATRDNRVNRASGAIVNKSTTQENTTMSNVKTTATAVAAKNKSAVVTVAKLEAGRIAIKQVSKVITPKLPMMVRGYADSEIGRLVLANLFNFAVTQFAPTNQNAQIVADAMLEGAMLEMLQKFNFEEMINDVVNKVDISKLTGSEE